MFLAKDIYLAEKIEYIEQNLLRIEREEEENKKNVKYKKENRPFAKCNDEKYRNLII